MCHSSAWGSPWGCRRKSRGVLAPKRGPGAPPGPWGCRCRAGGLSLLPGRSLQGRGLHPAGSMVTNAPSLSPPRASLRGTAGPSLGTGDAQPRVCEITLSGAAVAPAWGDLGPAGPGGQAALPPAVPSPYQHHAARGWWRGAGSPELQVPTELVTPCPQHPPSGVTAPELQPGVHTHGVGWGPRRTSLL